MKRLFSINVDLESPEDRRALREWLDKLDHELRQHEAPVCSCCNGSGEKFSYSRGLRPCPKCKGTGEPDEEKRT